MHDTTKDPVDCHSPATSAQAPEGNADSPSFSVFRFRKMADNSSEFYDPVTDILNILPQAIQSTMETLDGILEGTDAYLDACTMATNIHQLFQIRLIEQKDSPDEVLSDFIAVYKNTPMWLRTMFTETLFINLMSMWAISQRRASHGESKPLIAPDDEMRLGSLLSYLRPETKSAVIRDLLSSHKDAIKSLQSAKASDEEVYFTDEHGNVILEDAKKFVASMIPIKDGPKSWDSIAKALESIDRCKIENMAAIETYPGYINGR